MEGMTTLIVNGKAQKLRADPRMPLLYALRDHLGLTGTKYGCGAETCGACAVLVDGARALSCSLPLAEVAGRQITTIEGLSGNGDRDCDGDRADAAGDSLHPLQQAFIDANAFQCGYCTPGIIITAKALLDRDPDPDEDSIRLALQDNLCRCGSHNPVIRAVQRAAAALRGERHEGDPTGPEIREGAPT